MRTSLRGWVNLRRPGAEDFDAIYRDARLPPALPWYHSEPPRMLTEAVRAREQGGRALDIGCGDGLCSVYLARAGYDVTALDFAQGALDMTLARAALAGVRINAVRASVLTWSTPTRFDLIVDSLCLHVRAFRNDDRRRYKQQVVEFLGPDGDYVLVHFDRMFPFDWRPVGPRRRSRREILALFAPDLLEVATDAHDHRVPLPVGPVVRERAYWFRRQRPAGPRAVT